jgi:5-methylcytosine-specific restriction enzyme A
MIAKRKRMANEERVWTLPEDRKPLTRKQIAALFLRQDGKCPNCGQKLETKGNRPVEFIDEHVNPLWRGGSNDLKNRELWCIPCTKPKTAKEAGERAKGLNIRDKHIGAKKPKGPPMPGSKNSKWKKPMRGNAVRRSDE